MRNCTPCCTTPRHGYAVLVIARTKRSKLNRLRLTAGEDERIKRRLMPFLEELKEKGESKEGSEGEESDE